jgi:hypothetical protein
MHHELIRENRAADPRPPLLILVAMLIVPLVACSVFPRIITYRSPGIVGHGTQGAWSTRIRYHSVEIGNPGRPVAACPVVTLKLPDGTIVRTDRLDVTQLLQVSAHLYEDPPLRSAAGWPSGLKEIRIGDYGFLVVEGKVVSVLVGSGRASNPAASTLAIGDAQGTLFYDFPLAPKHLTHLFGKPHSVSKDLADLP